MNENEYWQGAGEQARENAKDVWAEGGSESEGEVGTKGQSESDRTERK